MKINLAKLEYASPEKITQALTALRDTLNFYGIHRLLIDASGCSQEVSMARVLHLRRQFLLLMSGTPLRKIARVRSGWPGREALVAEVDGQVQESTRHYLAFRNFDSAAEAISWLQET